MHWLLPEMDFSVSCHNLIYCNLLRYLSVAVFFQNMNKKLLFLPLCAAAFCSALLLSACSSSSPVINATHGAKADDGATYGSGPDNTKPYPQSEPVNLNGVGGAKVKYEPLSRGGNKNYTVLGKNYQVWRDCSSYLEIGTASWYGPGFHGNKTSNGEVYNQKGYSAAHKNLPLPSYLKVTNLENGKAVIVRVNDRGPFHGSRIIDLSEGAAKAIDMTGKGTATVKLEYIDVRQGNQIANLAHTVLSGQGSASILSGSSSKADAIGDFIKDLNNGNQPSLATTIAAGAAAVKIAGTVSDKLEQHAALEEQPLTASSSTVQSTAAQPQFTISNAELTPAAATDSTASTASAYVQIFTTMDQARASKVQNDYRSNTSYPILVVAEEGLYRVRIGPIPESDLQRVLTDMRNQGFKDAFIKR